MNLTEILNEKYNDLTSTEASILGYIIQNIDSVSQMSVQDLSAKTHSSESSIIRMSQKLGFSGFSEFKFSIKQQNLGNREEQNTTSLGLLRDDIDYTYKLFENSNYKEIIDLVYNSNKVYLFGTGWGENRAMESLFRNFLSLQVHTVLLPSITELNWNVDIISSSDIIFVTSFTGATPDLLPALKKLKIKGTQIISLTPFHTNYLSGLANYNLYYVLTNLKIDNKPYKEFNYYTTLELLVDCIFRVYYDMYCQIEIEERDNGLKNRKI